MAVSLEQLLDRIAENIILSSAVNPEVIRKNQFTIKNGIKTVGRTNSDKLILYQLDEQANKEDLLHQTDTGGENGLTSKLQTIADTIEDINQVTVTISESADGGIANIILYNENIFVF